jgi:hypothetical protein
MSRKKTEPKTEESRPVEEAAAETSIDAPVHPRIAKAEQAVRDLAKEKGTISAREAHDAWRWVLVSCSSEPWRQGDFDVAARIHPLLCAFDALPEDKREHALAYLEVDDAEQNDRDRGAGESIEAVPG